MKYFGVGIIETIFFKINGEKIFFFAVPKDNFNINILAVIIYTCEDEN